MEVTRLVELRKLAQGHFGSRALYRGTTRHDPERDREDGFVKFLLYDAFVFGFGFSGAPYTSVSCFYQATESVNTSLLLGRELAFVENRSSDIIEAFEVIDQYCRLRLTDDYLAVFDSL